MEKKARQNESNYDRESFPYEKDRPKLQFFERKRDREGAKRIKHHTETKQSKITESRFASRKYHPPC
ncbi:MAG: hypothetical protein WAN50_03665 [Minisyncoccia bacterium]